jgi:adenosylcobyric acid synthase
LGETLGLFRFVRESYERLATSFQALVIEGAGSAAEMNLRDRDIANWRVAELADASVVLVADIDQGGVFAQVIGTMDLLTDEERRRVIGIIVNKFRGDRRLFAEGVSFLEQRTGVPVLGVIPFLGDLTLDEEDRVHIERTRFVSFSSHRINIAVILLPRMSNFTDFNHLAAEEDVVLRYSASPADLEGADAVMIPGSKNTIADLGYLRASGFVPALEERLQRGAELIGVCGGYQMLGREISDPYGMESGGSVSGLGFLDVATELTSVKTTEQVQAIARHLPDTADECVSGYYIHLGRTTRVSGSSCFRVVQRAGAGSADAQCADASVDEGACRSDGSVWGTYIHGVFDKAGFRRAWLNKLRRRKGLEPLQKMASEAVNERLAMELDRWADHLRTHLDFGAILSALHADRISDENIRSVQCD